MDCPQSRLGVLTPPESRVGSPSGGHLTYQAPSTTSVAPSLTIYETYELCLRCGDAMRIVTRDIIRDHARVWDDLVDQTLVHNASAEWEFFEDGPQHLLPIVDIPAIDERLEQEDDHALFYFIIQFLETGTLDLGFHLDHVYGEPRASFYTLLNVHQVAQFLKIPELASAALTEITRRAYRIHRAVEGIYDHTSHRNNNNNNNNNNSRRRYRRYRPRSRPRIDGRFADHIASFVRCLVEVAEAMPATMVAQGGMSIDVPKELGITLVSAAYMLWTQLELADMFRIWWSTREGRLFRGLMLQHREPDWVFGTWRDWLAM
ncbi:hypothetical protein VM1G_02060 [Cytospora mali]|uniref:Uncharacterized protein n=1 Tax=Cytospora mali TaxID=578113 RepID=A0A194VRV0_CYTMA|nr:hypothetical protein VM1G_02060 [Valsa mali]